MANKDKGSFRSLLEAVATVPLFCNLPPSKVIYRIKGSGIARRPSEAANTQRVLTWLESQGIEVTESSSGSAANADAYKVRAAFLDGGLWGMTGNYWAAPRGVWIVGEQAVQFVLSGGD